MLSTRRFAAQWASKPRRPLDPLTVLLLAAPAKDPPLIDLDGTVFVQWGIFLVTAALLSRFLFRPFLKVRADREAGIEGARQQAETMDEEARARLADYEGRLNKERLIALSDKQALRTEATRYERETSEAAQRQAHARLGEERGRIQAEAETARKQLEPRAAEMSRDIVKKLLGREVA